MIQTRSRPRTNTTNQRIGIASLEVSDVICGIIIFGYSAPIILSDQISEPIEVRRSTEMAIKYVQTFHRTPSHPSNPGKCV
jgi:hypothetical protein